MQEIRPRNLLVDMLSASSKPSSLPVGNWDSGYVQSYHSSKQSCGNLSISAGQQVSQRVGDNNYNRTTAPLKRTPLSNITNVMAPRGSAALTPTPPLSCLNNVGTTPMNENIPSPGGTSGSQPLDQRNVQIRCGKRDSQSSDTLQYVTRNIDVGHSNQVTQNYNVQLSPNLPMMSYVGPYMHAALPTTFIPTPIQGRAFPMGTQGVRQLNQHRLPITGLL